MKICFWIALAGITIYLLGHEIRLYIEAKMKNKAHEIKRADATQYAGGEQYLVTVVKKDGN